MTIRMNRKDIPNTRKGFIEKWNTDNVFRCKAKDAGFNVIFDSVVFPDGRVADKRMA